MKSIFAKLLYNRPSLIIKASGVNKLLLVHLVIYQVICPRATERKRTTETLLSAVRLKIIKIRHHRLNETLVCPHCTLDSCKQTKRCLHSLFLIKSRRVCPPGAECISFNIKHLQSRYSTSTSTSLQSSSPQCLLMDSSLSETASSKKAAESGFFSRFQSEVHWLSYSL